MNRDRKVGKEIKSLNNLLCRNFVRNLKEHLGEDATVMHGWILIFIVKSEPDEVFQKDVEKEFKIAKSTATAILKLMEKKDLITRESVPYDERLKKLCLTDKGRNLTDRMWEKAQESDKALVAGIPQDKLDIFYSVLDEINKNASVMK